MAQFGGVVHQQWPSGTSASASSYHDPNPSEFYPRLAIDDNTATFWNDNTDGQYPDVLTISLPSGSPVNLTGLLVVSHPSDGYIIDYSVSVRTKSRGGVAATRLGVADYYSSVTFRADGSMTNGAWALIDVEEVSISVTRTGGDHVYSRINEVYPVFATEDESSDRPPSTGTAGSGSSGSSGSAISMPTTVPPASTSTQAVDAHGQLSGGAIAGISIGAAIVIAAIAACITFYMLRRRKAARQQYHSGYMLNQEQGPQGDYGANLNQKQGYPVGYGVNQDPVTYVPQQDTVSEKVYPKQDLPTTTYHEIGSR